ncbi:MAG TPA: hypothetical protein DIT99_24740 [Candidatus Latescibacteria bacterium]|nr:hypothetical protein [Candidatus Latescibacterota bacterium]
MIDGIRVIDFHGHVGRWERFGMNDNPKLMLHAMDAVGIDVSCRYDPQCPPATSVLSSLGF